LMATLSMGWSVDDIDCEKSQPQWGNRVSPTMRAATIA
jgi:hypothetical protein